jgi:hypothetical protein
MSKSMWAAYQAERGMATFIERDFGFVSYSIANRECYLQDLYIVPEKRTSWNALSLIKEVQEIAEKSNCTHVSTTVVARAKNATLSLKGCLTLGFELTGVSGDSLILLKRIRG